MEVTTSLCSSGSQSGVPGPATWMSLVLPGNLLQMHIHGPYPDLLNQTLGVIPASVLIAFEVIQRHTNIWEACSAACVIEQVPELGSADLVTLFAHAYMRTACVAWDKLLQFSVPLLQPWHMRTGLQALELRRKDLTSVNHRVGKCWLQSKCQLPSFLPLVPVLNVTL